MLKLVNKHLQLVNRSVPFVRFIPKMQEDKMKKDKLEDNASRSRRTLNKGMQFLFSFFYLS